LINILENNISNIRHLVFYFDICPKKPL